MKFQIAVPYADITYPLRTKVNITFQTRGRVTGRMRTAAELMGFNPEDVIMPLFENVEIEINSGDIVYVTGPSGSGKSLLLRELVKALSKSDEFMPVAASWELYKLIDYKKPIIDQVGEDVYEAVKILNTVGLSDTFTWFRKYNELSDGQKMRFLLAKAIDLKAKTVVIDEFCSVLDRYTACAVAYAFQKYIRKHSLTLVVGTAHDDLITDLQPTVVIHKDWGPNINISQHQYEERPWSLLDRVIIEPGTIDDWHKLAFLHYRSHTVAGPKVYRARINNWVVGVVVYVPSVIVATGARRVFRPEWYINEQFRHVRRISRIVVHPNFRNVGVAKKLLLESMPQLGVPFVEILSAMERLIPFTQKIMQISTEVASRNSERLIKDFKQTFGIDPRKYTAEQIFMYIKNVSKTRQLRSWVAKHAHDLGVWMHTEAQRLPHQPLKALKILKSVAAPKIYAVWVNPNADPSLLRKALSDWALELLREKGFNINISS